MSGIMRQSMAGAKRRDRFDELVAALRKCEMRRVAEHEILMGTMARFYVSE